LLTPPFELRLTLQANAFRGASRLLFRRYGWRGELFSLFRFICFPPILFQVLTYVKPPLVLIPCLFSGGGLLGAFPLKCHLARFNMALKGVLAFSPLRWFSTPFCCFLLSPLVLGVRLSRSTLSQFSRFFPFPGFFPFGQPSYQWTWH